MSLKAEDIQSPGHLCLHAVDRDRGVPKGTVSGLSGRKRHRLGESVVQHVGIPESAEQRRPKPAWNLQPDLGEVVLVSACSSFPSRYGSFPFEVNLSLLRSRSLRRGTS